MPAAARKKYVPRKQFLEEKHAPTGALGKVQYIDYAPRGAVRELFKRRDESLVICGPAGTGKSRGCLEKVHFACEKYAKARVLMFRKTRRSLTQTSMVTLENEVYPYKTYVPFHGGDQEYRYPNGTILAVAGMDDPKKILSSQWDMAYAPQAEELTQDDWEMITMRLRNGVMPYQQLLGDVNPAQSGHWMLSLRAAGALVMLESRHEDNPRLWDAVKGEWTEYGRTYIGKLDKLTGVRYKRYRKGIWCSAEGTVYEEVWDRAKHVIDRFNTKDLSEDQAPANWMRIWAVDFGYNHPFVWQEWAIDPDGRMYRIKEIYKTKTIVEDHAKRILEVTKNSPKPSVIICDHDAGDRATLEKHLGMPTKPAWKSVTPGLQAVESRLRIQDDGKPGMFFLRDSVVDIDRQRLEDHLPVCTEDEMEVYAWDTGAGKKIKEAPKKELDDGCDTTRYAATWVDKTGHIKVRGFPMISVTKSGGDSGGGGGSKWRMDGGSGSRWSNS